MASEAMGAAEAPDDVFAVVSYCPIPDPAHTGSAYEGWYGRTNTKERGLS